MTDATSDEPNTHLAIDIDEPGEGPAPPPTAAGPPTTHAGAFRALRSTPFRLYFAGQIASASGTFLQQVALGWLVLQLTGSAASLGLVLAASGLPSLVLGPWGGAIADRVDLRRLLIASQAVSAALAALLWVAASTGRASVMFIVIVSLVGGFVQIVDSPSRQAFVSSLVEPADLSSAVSLNGVVMNSARVVGPAVAGVLIATVGTAPCFAVNAGSYVAVIVALFAIRPLAPTLRRGRGTGGVKDGIRYVRSRQQLWLPLTMMALIGLLAFNFTVILPVLAQDTFGGTGGTYGVLSTALSVGSVAGSLLVGFIHHPHRTYLVAAATAFGASLLATAAAPEVTIACITLAVAGATGFAFVTLASTTLQLHASARYRARIMSLWVYVYLGTTPVGSIITGWISDGPGPRAAIIVGAASCFVAAGIATRVQTPPHPDADLTDLTDLTDLAVADTPIPSHPEQLATGQRDVDDHRAVTP